MFRTAARGEPGQVVQHALHGSQYPFRLNMYTEPPVQDITVEEFEGWALDRLRLLADIETGFARNQAWPELKATIEKRASEYLPLRSNAVAVSGASSSAATRERELQLERRKDHVSHFVLQLAFSRSEELRRRFVHAESALFRWKLETEHIAERDAFLQTQDFAWHVALPEDQRQWRDQLAAVHPRLAPTIDSEQFLLVPWYRVPELIERRRVFVHRGTAWVPTREQLSLVIAEFQASLQAQLEKTARALPRLDEDDRLMPVLEHLSMGFMAGTTTDYTNAALVGADGENITITADMVSGLVRRHAPLCMRHLHETLSATHHLRHYARLQYNLFLKELGLPVEEALIFWRRMFSTMTDDKFNKEHRYNIRHGYGLEGRRMSYPAKSCARIIMQDPPGPQDAHGCPFRHFSPANLSAALTTHYNVPADEQQEIVNTAKAGHYHVACTRLFELTHQMPRGQGLGDGESVSHPNRYMEASWRLSQR